MLDAGDALIPNATSSSPLQTAHSAGRSVPFSDARRNLHANWQRIAAGLWTAYKTETHSAKTAGQKPSTTMAAGDLAAAGTAVSCRMRARRR